jgi:ABC-type dipeptide/oligopeptide/nickel transport system permease component
MFKYIVRRVLFAIPILMAIIVATFAFSHALPGGPFNAAGQRRQPPQIRAQLEQKFNLHKPVFFNLPSDGKGSDTAWGETLVVKGHSDTSFTTEVFPEIPDAGIKLYGEYKLRDNGAESCLGQKAEPGWALISRREECVVTGGGVGETFAETKEVWRIDILDSQFWIYLGNVVVLDFGPSLNVAKVQENKQVTDDFKERIPVSVQLGVFSALAGFALGIPLGVIAALYHNSVVDLLATFIAVIGQSVPTIVLGPLLIIFFAVKLQLVPVADSAIWKEGDLLSLDYLKALALPVLTIATGMSAGIARMTRATLLQVLGEDYIRTARSKGLRERTVIYLHALKNSLIPVVTGFSGLIAGIVSGNFVVELIFSIPGMGVTFIDAVNARDYTTIMGGTIFFSTILILGNILVDVMYTGLDPRIRFD